MMVAVLNSAIISQSQVGKLLKREFGPFIANTVQTNATLIIRQVGMARDFLVLFLNENLFMFPFVGRSKAELPWYSNETQIVCPLRRGFSGDGVLGNL